MLVLPFSCRRLCRFSRLLAGGVGFDEGGDPVVQLVDPVEAAVAAGDDGDLAVRHEAQATDTPAAKQALREGPGAGGTGA